MADKLLAEKDCEVHTVAPDARVVDAVRAMNHHNIGALLVLEGSTIVGIGGQVLNLALWGRS